MTQGVVSRECKCKLKMTMDCTAASSILEMRNTEIPYGDTMQRYNAERYNIEIR